jgi:membrane-associated protein
MIDLIISFVNFLLHFDQHLIWFTDSYGVWVYLLLFIIIFCETGLVITPILPGDSMIFAAGALAAAGSMNVFLLFGVMSVAAILGNTVNYWIGKTLGPGIVYKKKIGWIKREYIDKTREFFDKHGGKTLILARFIPIIRTFAPFLAGVGSMDYFRFSLYNVVGCLAWVSLFLFGGFFFGNIPLIKENFTVVILILILSSFIPVFIGFFKHRFAKRS